MKKGILFVLQDNIYKEYGYTQFVDTLRRSGRNMILVTPVPFSNILLPSGFIQEEGKDLTEEDGIKIDNSEPVIWFGSMSLRRIAISQGLKPGKLGEGILNYSDWSVGFGLENILNPDVRIGTVESFKDFVSYSDIFVRPTGDTKALTGTVMEPERFVDWVESYSVIEPDGFSFSLNRTTEIMVSSVKKIYSECRVFVVDGRPVTASMYRTGNMVKHDRNVDERFYVFAKEMISRYNPEDGFVMDIADTPDGLKVIELNDFNCSGFYACDVGKIIMAIEDLFEGENQLMNDNFL